MSRLSSTNEEGEIDALLILQKKMKLRSTQGNLFPAEVTVYEIIAPYSLLLVVSTQHIQQIRADITKDMIARELRAWLDGKNISNPLLLIPNRIEEAITKYIKFGTPPVQEDLMMWLLSRSELALGPNAQLIFGGAPSPFTKTETIEPVHVIVNNKDNTDTIELTNEFPSNTRSSDADFKRPSSAPSGSKSKSMTYPGAESIASKEKSWVTDKKASDLNNSYYLAQKLIGKSKALAALDKAKAKGRSDAKATVTIATVSSEQFRIGADIEKARKLVEEAMEQRRMAIEICKHRQAQTADKYKRLRDTVKDATTGNGWMSVATNELETLNKIHADIKDDIMRHRTRTQRASQSLKWVIAPSGYANRRGKSAPGPVLGLGPLPPTATSKLKDPRVELTTKKYYWDTQGRRHTKSHDNPDADGVSSVDRAMEAIRRASANAASYKLDLKKVFDKFDASGDGYISMREMIQAFHSMGVNVDNETARELFQHFDPNNSGCVHYGEFAWAFFNRRSFVRQYKKSIKGLDAEQIRSKFHQMDVNGDGKINPLEMTKFLKKLGIVINDSEKHTLIARFDTDGDGCLDLYEFMSFLNDYNEKDDNNVTNRIIRTRNPIRPSSAPMESTRLHKSANTTEYSTTTSVNRPGTAISGGGKRDRGITASNNVIHESSVSRRTQGLHGVDAPSDEGINALLMADMLEKQANIEDKLGSRYY